MFWDKSSCSPVFRNKNLAGLCLLSALGQEIESTLFFETLVDTCRPQHTASYLLLSTTVRNQNLACTLLVYVCVCVCVCVFVCVWNFDLSFEPKDSEWDRWGIRIEEKEVEGWERRLRGRKDRRGRGKREGRIVKFIVLIIIFCAVCQRSVTYFHIFFAYLPLFAD
jgi:hypothetical protein